MPCFLQTGCNIKMVLIRNLFFYILVPYVFNVYCDDLYKDCGYGYSNCNDTWWQMNCPATCNLCKGKTISNKLLLALSNCIRLCHRRHLTLVKSVCETARKSLFWAPPVNLYLSTCHGPVGKHGLEDWTGLGGGVIFLEGEVVLFF